MHTHTHTREREGEKWSRRARTASRDKKKPKRLQQRARHASFSWRVSVGIKTVNFYTQIHYSPRASGVVSSSSRRSG